MSEYRFRSIRNQMNNRNNREDYLTTIYCPQCGNPMELRDTELWCSSGQMGLSRAVEQMIKDSFFSDEPVIADDNPAATPSDFHCPRCGQELIKAKLGLYCYGCRRIMPFRLQYELIELHPHTHWPRSIPRTWRQRLLMKWVVWRFKRSSLRP